MRDPLGLHQPPAQRGAILRLELDRLDVAARWSRPDQRLWKEEQPVLQGDSAATSPPAARRTTCARVMGTILAHEDPTVDLTSELVRARVAHDLAEGRGIAGWTCSTVS